MADKKSIAIVLGTAVGIAAVAAVGIYFIQNRETAVSDVNEIFEKARNTVKKLDEALEALKKTEG